MIFKAMRQNEISKKDSSYRQGKRTQETMPEACPIYREQGEQLEKKIEL